jgi:hypothetical protein
VRISPKTQRQLRELATESGRAAIDILEAAVDAYRRQFFLEQLNEQFARLRADPAAWREELAERKLWEGTLMDGLEDE